MPTLAVKKKQFFHPYIFSYLFSRPKTSGTNQKCASKSAPTLFSQAEQLYDPQREIFSIRKIILKRQNACL